MWEYVSLDFIYDMKEYLFAFTIAKMSSRFSNVSFYERTWLNELRPTV